MRTHLTIFLLLTFFGLHAQPTDSTRRQLFPDNRYGLFHQTIKDSTKKTVSTFGHYFSIGGGGEYDISLAGIGIMTSYSLAYKSHLLSLTYGGGGNPIQHIDDKHYGGNYFAVMGGESLRCKHFMFSLSLGIASTYFSVFEPSIDKFKFIYLQNRGISLPIEFKAFLLARKGIGFGITLFNNILSTPKYSPFYYGLSVVFGRWNVSSRENRAATNRG